MELLAKCILCIQILMILEVELGFSVYAPTDPVIKIEDGWIKGIKMTTKSGKQFDAYRGIPYAMPPVGELRFQAPRRVKPWDGILDATKDGPFCIQKNYFFVNPKVEGQEDCLYLNVYSPTHSNRSELLPVMVSIHWGGFFAGRGSSDYLGPNILLEKDVILVTFNYRLGILGLLSTLDDEAPGNYGLKDQVAVLNWVKKNIENFGGDKSRVTIFGASAGGGSTHLHIVSPLSKGLFQQAISQSGSALALWATPLNELHKMIVNIQAIISGCDASDSKILIDCLRGKNAADLVASGDAFKYFTIDPLNVYTLVIEKKTKRNPKPFLTKLPIEYIQAGEFSKVPWIIGTVKNEGALKSAALTRQTNTRLAFNQNFSSLMPKEMYYEVSVGSDVNKVTDLYKKVQQFYMEGEEYLNPSDPTNVQGFTDIWSDRSFKYSIYQSIMIHAAHDHIPIWVYTFEYKGKYSYGNLWAGTDEKIDFDWGATHCDDLLYLFDSPGLFPALDNKNDQEMSRILTDRWTNFAIFGSPQRSTYENFWEKVNFTGLNNMKNDNLYFLNITGSYSNSPIKETMQNGFYKQRMLFWASQQLFENFNGLQ